MRVVHAAAGRLPGLAGDVLRHLRDAVGVGPVVVARGERDLQRVPGLHPQLDEGAGELLEALAEIRAVDRRARDVRRGRAVVGGRIVLPEQLPVIGAHLHRRAQRAEVPRVHHRPADFAVRIPVVRVRELHERRRDAGGVAVRRALQVARGAVALVESDVLGPQVRRDAPGGAERLHEAAGHVGALLQVGAEFVAADVLVLPVIAAAQVRAEVGRRREVRREAQVGDRRGPGGLARKRREVLRGRRLVAVGIEDVGRDVDPDGVGQREVLRDGGGGGVHRPVGRRGLAAAVARLARDDVDHAGDGEVAPEARIPAADDLDPLDRGERHLEPLHRRVERVEHRDSIDHHQHLGVGRPAHPHLVAGRVGLVVRRPAEVDAGHLPQQLVERLRRRVADVVPSDHGRVERHLGQRGVAAGRRDDEAHVGVRPVGGVRRCVADAGGEGRRQRRQQESWSHVFSRCSIRTGAHGAAPASTRIATLHAGTGRIGPQAASGDAIGAGRSLFAGGPVSYYGRKAGGARGRPSREGMSAGGEKPARAAT